MEFQECPNCAAELMAKVDGPVACGDKEVSQVFCFNCQSIGVLIVSEPVTQTQQN